MPKFALRCFPTHVRDAETIRRLALVGIMKIVCYLDDCIVVGIGCIMFAITYCLFLTFFTLQCFESVFVFEVTTEKPVTATIYQVKKQDKGDVFKKKASWPIRQLKVFDAKFTNKVCGLLLFDFLDHLPCIIRNLSHLFISIIIFGSTLTDHF